LAKRGDGLAYGHGIVEQREPDGFGASGLRGREQGAVPARQYGGVDPAAQRAQQVCDMRLRPANLGIGDDVRDAGPGEAGSARTRKKLVKKHWQAPRTWPKGRCQIRGVAHGSPGFGWSRDYKLALTSQSGTIRVFGALPAPRPAVSGRYRTVNFDMGSHMQIEPSIFKAYDIRGIVGKTLTPKWPASSACLLARPPPSKASGPWWSAATAACPGPICWAGSSKACAPPGST
jgi:hypothetical protein